jgi:hypothetical protein
MENNFNHTYSYYVNHIINQSPTKRIFYDPYRRLSPFSRWYQSDERKIEEIYS